MIFFLQVFGVSIDSVCPGPNSYLDSNSVCRCAEGFPFGDPDSLEGCFNCINKCHLNGQCVAKNVCKCIPGYIGDGFLKCFPRFPLPIYSFPNQSSISGGNLISIILSNITNVKSPYCRFGDLIVSGNLLNETTIQCLNPSSNPGRIELRVSDDSNDWNLPGIPFYYVNNGSDIVYIIAAGACSVPLFIIIRAFIICWKRKTQICEEENISFKLSKVYESRPHNDLSMHGFYPL